MLLLRGGANPNEINTALRRISELNARNTRLVERAAGRGARVSPTTTTATPPVGPVADVNRLLGAGAGLIGGNLLGASLTADPLSLISGAQAATLLPDEPSFIQEARDVVARGRPTRPIRPTGDANTAEARAIFRQQVREFRGLGGFAAQDAFDEAEQVVDNYITRVQETITNLGDGLFTGLAEQTAFGAQGGAASFGARIPPSRLARIYGAQQARPDLNRPFPVDQIPTAQNIEFGAQPALPPVLGGGVSLNVADSRLLLQGDEVAFNRAFGNFQTAIEESATAYDLLAEDTFAFRNRAYDPISNSLQSTTSEYDLLAEDTFSFRSRAYDPNTGVEASSEAAATEYNLLAEDTFNFRNRAYDPETGIEAALGDSTTEYDLLAADTFAFRTRAYDVTTGFESSVSEAATAFSLLAGDIYAQQGAFTVGSGTGLPTAAETAAAQADILAADQFLIPRLFEPRRTDLQEEVEVVEQHQDQIQ